MKTRTRGIAVAALVSTSMLFLSAPAMAAPAILGISDGTLLAKGVGVQISVTFQCDEGFHYTIDLGLGQKVSKGVITSGNSQVDGDCTGSTQSRTLVVGPNLFDGTPMAYKSGTGLATVILFNVGETQSSTKEVRIRN